MSGTKVHKGKTICKENSKIVIKILLNFFSKNFLWYGREDPNSPSPPPWEVPVGVIPHPVRGNPENSPLPDLGEGAGLLH